MSRLREQLIAHFDDEELRTLCFDLNVDYDSLPALGKAGKTRELVATLDRANRLQELVELCAGLRPNVPWAFQAECSAGSDAQFAPASSKRGVRGDRLWIGLGAVLVVLVTIIVLRLNAGRDSGGTQSVVLTPLPTPTVTSTPSQVATLTPLPSPTPSLPLVTMSVTVGEGDICTWDDAGPVLLRSVLDIGINNNSDRDIMLTSVKLAPEWIAGGVYAGELVSTKTYTVTADAWFRTWMDALDQDKLPALRAAGKLKEIDGMPWVQPDPIEVKGIPAGKYTIKRHSQERFQIQVGISDAVHYVWGTLYVEIEDDAGNLLRQGPLEVYICGQGEYPSKQ